MGLGERCTIHAGPCTSLVYSWDHIAALFKSWVCVVQSHSWQGGKRSVFIVYVFSVAKEKMKIRELDGTCAC